MNENENGFSTHERRLLAHVLDVIIPPRADGALPGAGELGLVEHVDRALDPTPDTRPMISEGLAAVSRLAAERNPAGFEALDLEERTALLNELSESQPTFLPSLLFHTYLGYYQNARVLEGLGMEGRPPYPKGYELEVGDLSLLEKVKKRDKLFREVD